jgi:hypothetical protein
MVVDDPLTEKTPPFGHSPYVQVPTRRQAPRTDVTTRSSDVQAGERGKNKV